MQAPIDPMLSNSDIVIVGGGLVGTTLAYALAKQPIRVVLLDNKPISSSPGLHEQRALALTLASQRIYQSLGIWPFIQVHATPIQRIHVSDAGHFNHTHFAAKDYHLEVFGHVVQAGQLQKTLDHLIHEQSNLTMQYGTQVKGIKHLADGVLLAVETPEAKREIKTRLVIAADGTSSTIRQLLNIQVKRWDYQQTALVAQVQLSKPHAYVAYERFKQDEVIAALPFTQNKAVIVWTISNDKWQLLQTLSPELLLAEIQQAFGYRLGRFEKLLQHEIYPLMGLQAREQCRQNVVLMGNAVHTLHPIAAQGLNLGLRDVAVLIELLTTTLKKQHNLQSIDWLIEYEKRRQNDQDFTITATNQLLRLFRSEQGMAQLSRHFVMSALNFMPALKRRFAERAMGLVNVSSKLITRVM